jgi:hypothetical protein
METITGTRCAEALVAVGLPTPVVVRALVAELGLTYDEATRACQSVVDLREVTRR